MQQAVKPVIFSLAPTGKYGHRLVIDLYAIASTSSNKTKTASAQKNTGQRDVIIAIDAGHGGRDPGSIGPAGTYEKHVTLQIAKRLAALIDKQPGMKARLTRSSDYFVKLDRRTARARQRKADFFVSIHADAFSTPQPSGASRVGVVTTSCKF